GPLRWACPRGPDVAGDRRAVAGGVEEGPDDPVAHRPPVVEADVAGAAGVAPCAQVAREVPLRVARLNREGLCLVPRAYRRQLRLEPGRAVDGLALLRL